MERIGWWGLPKGLMFVPSPPYSNVSSENSPKCCRMDRMASAVVFRFQISTNESITGSIFPLPAYAHTENKLQQPALILVSIASRVPTIIRATPCLHLKKAAVLAKLYCDSYRLRCLPRDTTIFPMTSKHAELTYI